MERRNDGIILLDWVKYIYFVQPLRDNIQLVFLVDATHYVTLVKKQYPFGIFLSMDVFTQGRSIYSDNIGQSLVFPVTAFTSGLNYLPELTGNDSNLLIVFYVQIMPDDFVMQLHRF